MARESRLVDSQATAHRGNGANAGFDEEVATMFAVDDETGQLTRDGQPAGRQLERIFDLLGCDASQFEDELARGWCSHGVPGSDELLWLPDDRRSWLWDQWVEELAVAYRSGGSWGPMTSDGWQRICCVDDIYFILDGGSCGVEVRVVGINAYCEAIESADAFVEDDYGSAVSIWADEDDPDPEDLTWQVDDWDEEDDNEEDDEDRDEEELAMIAEARTWQQRLWSTVITHARTGVILAGRGGSSPLPGPGDWFVVPVPTERLDELSDTLDGQPVTVVEEDVEFDALLTQDLQLSSAARMAEAFGYEFVWELSADQVRLIRCEPYSIVANALRDMA